MKTFSPFEKKIINKIANDTNLGRNITNILDEYLMKTCIFIDNTAGSVDLKFEIKENQPTQEEKDWILNQRLKEIQIQIIQILNLLKYLEKNGFITTYKTTNVSQPTIKFGRCAGSNYMSYSFPDPKIKALLLEYVEMTIEPNLDLIDIIAYDYQTKDERRYNNQKHQAWIAIIIAVIIQT